MVARAEQGLHSVARASKMMQMGHRAEQGLHSVARASRIMLMGHRAEKSGAW